MPIDYSEYPPDWQLRSYFVRVIRAGNRCEWCGAENFRPHPVTGSKVVLTTAHIWQSKRFNWLMDLAALCQRCHLNHDRKHHVLNRKYGRQWKNDLLFILMQDYEKLTLMGCFQLIRELMPDAMKEGLFKGKGKESARVVINFCSRHTERFWMRNLLSNEASQIQFGQVQKNIERLIPKLAKMHPEELEQLNKYCNEIMENNQKPAD